MQHVAELLIVIELARKLKQEAWRAPALGFLPAERRGYAFWNAVTGRGGSDL